MSGDAWTVRGNILDLQRQALLVGSSSLSIVPNRTLQGYHRLFNIQLERYKDEKRRRSMHKCFTLAINSQNSMEINYCITATS
mmetsp:Transcript_27672/g.40833  ORF Transcript_27672/g.40833 Transcript_27672/m.40833 type:complete len:83 (+) Transcript_27672:1848-2096(+)